MSIIHAGSDPSEFYHVPGNINPADACTHGVQAHKVEKWKKFHRGPEFLYQPESSWPAQKSYLRKAPPQSSIMSTQVVPVE